MIRWGIIGAGTIAHRFAESLEKLENTELLAVANRTIEKAVRFKEKYSATYAYADYQQLLDNPEVDIVYIALPHAYHYEWIKKAIVANKGILCEKPIVLRAAELEDILDLLAKTPVFFMEAMKSRFVPAYVKAKELIFSNTIGELTHIDTSLRRYMPKESTSYHYDAIQGGCLLDMGVYNVSLIEDFISVKPTIQTLKFEQDRHQVETFVETKLTAGSIDLSIEVGFDKYKEAFALFTGNKGKLYLPNFHRPTKIILELSNQEAQTIDCPYLIDDFDGEITHVMSCFKEGLYESPLMPWQASLRSAKILDQLKQAIKEATN